MNCIAIDDEPLALNIIKDFCGKLDFLNLIATFHHPIEAIETIEKEQIDLIFLDIEMPHISGMEFIQSLEKAPLLIFTTAYSQYAHQAYNLNAVDYLMKPIPFERFFTAVSKAKKQLEQEEHQIKPTQEFIMVNADHAMLKIFFRNIQFIEGLKDYVKIYMQDNEMVLTKTTMKNMEDKIPSNMFIRVHKSYIINLSQVDRIEQNRIIIGKEWIPVSAGYKEAFFNIIEQFKV